MAFQYFMKALAKATFAYHVCVTENENPRKEGKLTAYCRVVHNRLPTYATDDVIAQTEAETTNFKPPNACLLSDSPKSCERKHYVAVLSLKKHFLT